MAVRDSCTARAAQVREAARAAAAKVAAVELRVTEAVDGGAPLRGWGIPGVDRFAFCKNSVDFSAKRTRCIRPLYAFASRDVNTEKVKEKSTGTQSSERPRAQTASVWALMYLMCVQTCGRYRSSSATRYLSSSSSSRPPRSSTARAAT